MSVSLTKNYYLPYSIQIISLDNTWEFAEDGYFRPYPHEIQTYFKYFHFLHKNDVTEVTFYIGYVVIDDYVQFIIS